MEETLDWFMEPKVKANHSIPQDEISALNLNLEFGSTKMVTYSSDIFYPLSSKFHDSLCHDPLDQSAPPTSSSHSLDFQVSSLNCTNQVQGTQVT